jgi:hypothetical protein
MTIKNLLMLGGVIAGAAYLQDKGRRDRLFGQARGLFDKAKARASELASQTRHDNGVSQYGAGSTGRDAFGDSGISGSRTYR